jgi:LysM repeat protein
MLGKIVLRILAPLALASVAVGVYLIVHSTVIKQHSSTSSTNTTLTKNQRGGAHKAKPKAKPTIYVVKQGDTLSLIAEKTGVPLSRLTALNHAVSQPPYSLQTGQRLRLRR